jgi:pseudouridine synthase
MKIRLNKYLAQAGVASRREADRMIAEGRVCVNRKVVDTLGFLVEDGKDRVEIDGKAVKPEKALLYLILNKPRGYLVTRKDPFQRPTIMDLLPFFKARIFPVGRLDLDSEGLLLLTNDGDLAHRLMHPRYKVNKIYTLRVKKKPEPASLARLERGIFLDGKRTAPAKIRVLSSTKQCAHLRVEIHEGRKRELKRMFETIGHRVTQLKRIRFGSLYLGTLKRGQWRFLTREEIGRLKKLVQLK